MASLQEELTWDLLYSIPVSPRPGNSRSEALHTEPLEGPRDPQLPDTDGLRQGPLVWLWLTGKPGPGDRVRPGAAREEGQESLEFGERGEVAGGKGEHGLHLWPREAAWAFGDLEEDPGPEGGAGSRQLRTEGARELLSPTRPTGAPALPVPTAGVLARLGPGAGNGVSCA